ncbi:hypothetical protein RRG08_033726 [Elysia crispata]|uniref:Uncharacterized protein n=1 Tax=Elysia crispata TaxID=231223 RepID=A0AAE1A8V9_9GAST|nr:hypothetical protein RRG08_033726 [Elysia crispata]
MSDLIIGVCTFRGLGAAEERLTQRAPLVRPCAPLGQCGINALGGQGSSVDLDNVANGPSSFQETPSDG